MKSLFSLITLMFLTLCSKAQNQPNSQIERPDSILVKVHLNGGDERMGYLVELDQEKVVLWTDVLGRISIPKYAVKYIEELNEDDLIPASERTPHYSGRYHLLCNGLPQYKGAKTRSFTLGSIDYQWAKSERLTVGVVGSYALTAIGNVNYSVPLLKNLYGSVGGHLGLSYALGGIFVPYASITYGTAKANITLGGGFAHISFWSWDGEFTPQAFAAATIPVGKKVQWVTETFWTKRQNFSETYIIDGIPETTYESSYGTGYGTTAIRIPLKNSNCIQIGLIAGFSTWTDYYIPNENYVEAVGALPLISYSKSW